MTRLQKDLRIWIRVAAGLSALFSTDALAQSSICDAGPQTITGVVLVDEPCTVSGDLVIEGNGILFVNYRGAPQNRFTIEGDLVARGDAAFYFAGGVLEFQQAFRSQREIRSFDRARLVIVDAEIATSQDRENRFMVHHAHDQSQAIFMYCRLDYARSWLIVQSNDASAVRVVASDHVPSEVYLRSRSTLSVQGSVGQAVWMEFNDHSSGRIDLPDQVDDDDLQIAYSFRAGRQSTTLDGIEWQLEVVDSKVGLGVESHVGSEVWVRGAGRPRGGELRVSYSVEGGTFELHGLQVGLVNAVLDDGRLILENVSLGLAAWQIYVRHADALITNSVINEIGVSTNGRARVEGSILQLASLASLGEGSVLEVHGSQMYSQGMDVGGDGRVTVTNTSVHGTSFQTTDARAQVEIRDSAFVANPSDCTFETMFDTLTGIPRCNPFVPPGAPPKRSGPGVVTCTNTLGCAW